MSDFSNNVSDHLHKAQELYRERNAVYKDNFRAVGAIMKKLFPDRQPTLETGADFNRWHIFELFIVKLTRYAANWHRGGHRDSLQDMIVYLSMLIELDREYEEHLDENPEHRDENYRPDLYPDAPWITNGDTAKEAEEKYQLSLRPDVPYRVNHKGQRIIKDNPQA